MDNTCDSCCTRSLYSTVWGSILTIVVYTEVWSMDISQMKDQHPNLYKFMKGCYDKLKWHSSSISSNQDDVDLPKSLNYVLRGISTTIDFLLKSPFLQYFDLHNIRTVHKLGESQYIHNMLRAHQVGDEVCKEILMMVACSQFYIYLQPVEERRIGPPGDQSANDTENDDNGDKLLSQRLGDLKLRQFVVEITDRATKENIVKNSELIVGEVPQSRQLEKARIWKVKRRAHQLYGSSLEECVALLKSGIIEPLDVLAEAKGAVGASFVERVALLAQALGFLTAYILRRREHAPVSPLEMIASYYAFITLKRSAIHLLGITYNIRKPLLINLDIHKISPLPPPAPPPSASLLPSPIIPSWLKAVCFFGFDYVYAGILQWLVGKEVVISKCEQGKYSWLLQFQFISFNVLVSANLLLASIKWNFLKILVAFLMVVTLSTATGYTFYSWEDCYDQQISTKFSLPYLQ